MPINYSKLNYYFDPLIIKETQVLEKLKYLKNDTAIRFNKYLYFYNSSGNLIKEDISKENESKFISNISLDTAQKNLEQQLDKYKKYLEDISNYSLDLILKGSEVDLGINYSNKITTFVTTNKTHTFFDFSVYVFDNKINYLKNVNYSTRLFNNELTHSGDIGDLIHYVKINAKANNFYLLTVTGFNRTPLCKFKDQLPSVIGVNHNNKSLFMIPCSLSEVDVGNSCLSILGIITKKSNNISLYSFSKNYNVNNVTTGDESKETILELKKSIKEYQNFKSSNKLNKHILKKKKIETKNVEIDKTPLHNFTSDILIANQTNTTISYKFNNCQYINFSKGLVFSNRPKRIKSNISLPSLFGDLEGSSILALGKHTNITTTLESYHKFLNNTKLGIIYLSDDWKETITKSTNYVYNGIFIISTNSYYHNLSIFDILKKINRGGTIMAGPNSIILVQINEKLYFYRGVRYHYLLETLPEFGEDVTNNFSKDKLKNFISFGGFQTLPWNNVHKFKYDKVFYNNKKLSINTFIEKIKNYNFTEIKDNQYNLIDALTQLSIIMDSNTLSNFVNNIREYLDKIINQEKKQYSNIILKNIKNKKIISTQIGLIRKIQKSIKPLIATLGKLTSQRASNSFESDLRKQIRNNKISQNVSNANKMGIDEITKYVEEIENWALFGVNYTNINPCLELTSKNNFIKTMSTNLIPPFTFPHETCLVLDELTTACLIEAGTSQINHPFYSSTTLSVPYSLSKNTISAFPFPLIDKYVEMKIPTKYNWIDETNNPIIATWRIIFRSTIVNSIAGRKYNIPPASRELTFLIIKILLDSIEKLYDSLSCKPDFNDTSAQILRGLFGLLFTTMASGKTPTCLIFQLIYPNSKLEIPSKEHLWIIPKIIKVFNYTGWDDTIIKQNTKKLFIRILRKYITDPINKPRRQQISQNNIKKQNEYINSRKIELIWLLIACKVMKQIKQEDTLENLEISKRLLNIYPYSIINPKKGTKTVKKFIDYASNNKADWDGNPYTNMLNTVNGIIAKRSVSKWKVKTSEPDIDMNEINEIIKFIITGVNKFNKKYKIDSNFNSKYLSVNNNIKNLTITQQKLINDLNINPEITKELISLFDNFKQIEQIINILMNYWNNVVLAEEQAYILIK